MKKSMFVFFALVITASLVAVLFLNLGDVNSRNDKLATSLSELQEDYDTLRVKYYALLGNYSIMETSYANFLLQSPLAVPNPGSSGEEALNVSRYEALQSLYSKLKVKYDQFVGGYQQLRYQTDQRLLRGSAERFIQPADPAVMSLTYNITGKVGNTTDPGQYWKDIKAMYDWVNNNIKYREDGLYPILPEDPGESPDLEQTDQTAQMPNETLALKSGDCEDIAILLCSMVRSYFNKQFTVECIWLTGETAGHVAVQIPFSGEKLVILDPVRDYYSHDTLGDIALNNVSTEIYNWMNIWRPSLGNDVQVYRVFSDYVDKYFQSNEDYLNWMYNR
ncbi:MAG: transglutaminase family protein [Candidatus Bathyarchaeia archaeon]